MYQVLFHATVQPKCQHYVQLLLLSYLSVFVITRLINSTSTRTVMVAWIKVTTSTTSITTRGLSSTYSLNTELTSKWNFTRVFSPDTKYLQPTNARRHNPDLLTSLHNYISANNCNDRIIIKKYLKSISTKLLNLRCQSKPFYE